MIETAQLKQKMKDEYAKKVDLYFERFEEHKSRGILDINGIESLIGSGLADARETLITTSEELVKSEIDPDESKKKRARSAAGR